MELKSMILGMRCQIFYANVNEKTEENNINNIRRDEEVEHEVIAIANYAQGNEN